MIDPFEPTPMLRRLVQAQGGEFCERCKCCEKLWQDCDECAGEGEYDVEADDFDDTVIAAQCTTCGGCGGWWTCTCDEKGEHHS